jgi:hypothetical protein
MQTALGFSNWNDEKNINDKPPKSRTLKKRRHKKPSSKITNLLNTLSNTNPVSTKSDDDDEDDLCDFKPMAQSVDDNNDKTQEYNWKNNETPKQSNIEPFAQIDNISAQDYYKQYIPYYNKINNENSFSNQDDLMKKLNYMINLLEEQQDEKTNNVTEELVLYLFLGVFVIFVVDSFARAGKYTR